MDAAVSPVSYFQPEKPKSKNIMHAFAAGCGGVTASVDTAQLLPGPAAFYGVRPRWARLWHQAKAAGRDWYYVDNSYFDAGRERYFRVTRNALQVHGKPPASVTSHRLAALGVKVRPWRAGGRHVVLCPQSAEFMHVVAGLEFDWLAQAVSVVKAHTDRPLVIRKKGEARALQHDLLNAWALVTPMSAAAVEALLAGVPVFCTAPSAAQWLGLANLELIERPVRPDGREEWAAWLANNQWTVAEMQQGMAWEALRG